jgi:hypothetical protein
MEKSEITSTEHIWKLFEIEPYHPMGETFNEQDVAINRLANTYWDALREIKELREKVAGREAEAKGA